MPYLAIRTNVAVDDDARSRVLAAASQAVAAAVGKPERYVMVSLEAGAALLFAGSQGPAAAMAFDSIGFAASDAARVSAELCAVAHSQLGVPTDRVYIRFASTPRDMWGWNGGTF